MNNSRPEVRGQRAEVRGRIVSYFLLYTLSLGALAPSNVPNPITNGKLTNDLDANNHKILNLGPAPNYWDTSVEVSGSNGTTTSQSLVDIAGLSVALLANSVYEFEAVLLTATSNDSNGTAYGVNYSATGASVQASEWGTTTNISSNYKTIVTLNLNSTGWNTTANQTGHQIIHGLITTGSIAGNLTIKHLKVTSGTSTVKIGSILKVKKM